ncbi:MAG: DUF5946 family protein [Acidimicrobiia bacterium]
MAQPCRWCGVEACRDRFDECLALDFSDARYGAVHHLTAHTYALQHRIYTDGFEVTVAGFLLDHLEQPPTPGAMRALTADVDGGTRVRREEPGPPPSEPTGPSVADVVTDTPETYRASVRAWAQSVAERFVD